MLAELNVSDFTHDSTNSDTTPDLSTAFGFDLNKSLFHTPSEQSNPDDGFPRSVCVNTTRLADLFQNEFVNEFPTTSGYGYLERLQAYCIKSAIQRCTHRLCVETRKEIEDLTPDCGWRPYKDWVLGTTACLVNTYPKLPPCPHHIRLREAGLGEPSFPAELLSQLSNHHPISDTDHATMMFGVVELSLWMLETAVAFQPANEKPVWFERTSETFEDVTYTSAIQTAITQGAAITQAALYNGKDYAALSHVWSDGTGVGIGQPGRVNSCLVQYFNTVMQRLDCNGLWWDAISIPVERQARTRALNRMHENYQYAKSTIVHDRWLTQFPWNDDGSPCVALLLSSWFSRAWTALELISSKSVKVLFRGADETSPLIKDLDNDILAPQNAVLCRGYYIASSILRRLRVTSFDTLGKIHTVLETRAVSYARDRMIIANLLAGARIVEEQGSQAQLTRNLITFYGKVESIFLLHGHATMRDSGPWSWCPPSLFYSHTASHQRSILLDDWPSNRCLVDQNGILITCHEGLLLPKAGRNPCSTPFTYHLSVSSRIRAAMQQWEKCLMVELDYTSSQKRPYLALLVQPFAIGYSEGHQEENPGTKANHNEMHAGGGRPVLDCIYIGTIYYDDEGDWDSETRDYMACIRFGIEPISTTATARELADQFQQIAERTDIEWENKYYPDTRTSVSESDSSPSISNPEEND
ncbi:MAG: hypothetical protein Q9204_004195 [Flavoplaca sp. TL-2023a]